LEEPTAPDGRRTEGCPEFASEGLWAAILCVTSDSFGVRVGPSFAGSKGQVKAETAGGPRGVMCCSLRVGEHAHCHVLGSDWVGVCPTQKGPGYRTRRSARCGNAKVGVIIPSAYFPWGRFSAIQRGIWGSQRLRLKPVAFSPVPLHRPYGTNAKPERTTMLLADGLSHKERMPGARSPREFVPSGSQGNPH
jgi:hypothetical protein